MRNSVTVHFNIFFFSNNNQNKGDETKKLHSVELQRHKNEVDKILKTLDETRQQQKSQVNQLHIEVSLHNSFFFL